MQTINKIQLPLNQNLLLVKGFFVLFYAVGVAGMVLPFAYPFFIRLTPFALLLTTVALALFHEKVTPGQVVLYGVIFFTGFVIEAVGVYTGTIFGHYHYGQGLGLKLFNTPLIIGLNWLLLVYLTASVMEETRIHVAGKTVAGALLMVGYDLILEQVAPALDMWYWQDDKVPLQNYISWFILAVVFHALARALKANMKNKVGPFLFLCQTAFLVLLFILLN